MAKRVQVGGEEFEIEDPRVKRKPKPTTLSEDLGAEDDAGPPNNAERLAAFKALAQAENHVKNLYKTLGGAKGSRLVSLAIGDLERSFCLIGRHVATTQTPWR